AKRGFMSTKEAFRNLSCGLLVILFLCTISVHSALAQATFGVSSSSTVLAKTGYTELVGTVTFTVSSGTTQARTLEFFLANVLFPSTAGISVSGTGGLAASTIGAIAAESGIVIINFPAGATLGASVTLSGVRISAVGTTFKTIDAALSAS